MRRFIDYFVEVRSQFAGVAETLDELQASVYQQNRYAEEKFPVIVSQSNLLLCQQQNKCYEDSMKLLIGVATYSRYDMELLDLIDNVLNEQHLLQGHVYVFDITTCKTMECLEQYIPGIGGARQTPVVGVWQNGLLIAKGEGKIAKEIIRTNVNFKD